jgi:hypothetical protein
MDHFADQCLDMARLLLGHNLGAVGEDGRVCPIDGEPAMEADGAHAFAAIGEFYRTTHEVQIETFDGVDLGARCLSVQALMADENPRSLAHSSLGLLAFGPAKQRNLVWERLLGPTREELDRKLLVRTGAVGEGQAFEIAKSVARYSMGLTRKDDTGKLIDRFLDGIRTHSSGGYFSNEDGGFDLSGLVSFIFIRQALTLHVNLDLCGRKLPSIRTYAEKYLRLLADMVRADGLGWAYGREVGVYGQMYGISFILQSMRDGWIAEEKRELYLDCVRRLFHYFFATYLDQERGCLVVRDAERSILPHQTTRMVSFDAARYLCQWSRLARGVGGDFGPQVTPVRSGGRLVYFDKSPQGERGLFLYGDEGTGLVVQLPLVAGGREDSDSLAFPHCPGVFDWPAHLYLPVFVPELTFESGVRTIPCFYGKNCSASLGLRGEFYFRYEQPELVTPLDEKVTGIGSCKVTWTFAKSVVSAEFRYTVRQPVLLVHFRYVVPIASLHSCHHLPHAIRLGEEGLRITVGRNDFQAEWNPTQLVGEDPDYKTYWGKIHYLQTLERKEPLSLQPGREYVLNVVLDPDVTSDEAQRYVGKC